MEESNALEIEAKLVVVGGDRRGLFKALVQRTQFAGLPATPFEERRLVDRYFDFEDGRLARGDRALRLRQCADSRGERCLLTFKGAAEAQEGLGVTRVELEEEWSGAFLTRVFEHLGLGLGPVPAQGSEPRKVLEAQGLELVQERRTTRLASRLGGDAGEIAELVLDRVIYGLVNGQLVHQEIEVESRPGTDVHEVNRIAAELLREFANQLFGWRCSKTALGQALEQMEQAGTLETLRNGEQLSAEGYRAIQARLAQPR